MSGTARELARRLWLLLALTTAATCALFGSYQGLLCTAVPLRDTSAPAVLALDTARQALDQARAEDEDPAAGADFQSHLTVVSTSLAAVSAEDVTGLSGRQTLQTVTGLLTSYGNFVQLAHQEPPGPLRTGYLHFAQQVLDGDEGITQLLAGLQHRQRAVVGRQTSVGPALWTGWALTLVFGAALIVALVETQVYLRLRFRRRWNRPLLAACALLAGGVAVLAVFASWTASAYGDVRGALAVGTGDAGRIQAAGKDVARFLAGSGFRAGLAWWVLVVGAVLLGLVAAGLWPRVNDYRFRRTR
ncbi:hypothetical protein [Streptomyces fuscigenes]|uniref:hypothetical protein n=1 Tax=Streptomyces fuscigenes TaxID=1528880 RepID=UPI001F3511FB|nr:hypothetical protein [Streptomyces fuscigenes]MCF3962341.1 hypothetical protein [Streptomyces fuscigenes]